MTYLRVVATIGFVALPMSACVTGSPVPRVPAGVTEIALVGGTIYPSPDAQPVYGGVLLISNGMIKAVGDHSTVSIPSGATVIDVSGLSVVAGFWNSHVHFLPHKWGGADRLAADELGSRLQSTFTRYGFVRVVDLGSNLANTIAIRQRVESGEVPGPGILTTNGAIVPAGGSPFYLPYRLREVSTPEAARARVEELLDGGADAIKLHSGSWPRPDTVVHLPLEIISAVTDAAHRRGKLVFAHPSDSRGANLAVDGGVDVFAHVFVDAREGDRWDRSALDRAVAADVALVPTLKLFKWGIEQSANTEPADSIAAWIVHDLKIATDQLRYFSEAGGEVMFGTDVGFMDDADPTEEYQLMQEAGLSFPQILRSLTTTPSQRLGLAGQTGRLERGLWADVVVIDGDPKHDIQALARVVYAWRAGTLVYGTPGFRWRAADPAGRGRAW